jgi:hypothetical protein
MMEKFLRARKVKQNNQIQFGRLRVEISTHLESLFNAKKSMKLIFLDQNTISKLALSPSGEWLDVLELLQNGVKNKKILCPTPLETINESIHLSRSDREHIEHLSRKLSCGYVTKFFWQIIAQEILAKVRPDVDTSCLFSPPQIRNESNDLEIASLTQRIWKDKDGFEKACNVLEEPLKLKGFPPQYMIDVAITDWLKWMRRYLNKFRNGQEIDEQYFYFRQIFQSLRDLQVTDKEITGLLRASRTIEWLGIPFITCWLSLEGLLMYENMQHGRKFKYNDELDRSRAAIAFHVGNCFITDHKMKTMLKQLGADDSNHFDFKAFSVGESKNIITYLKGIC